MFGGVPRTFNTHFRCYSVVMFPGNEREDVERGGKSKLVFLHTISRDLICYCCVHDIVPRVSLIDLKINPLTPRCLGVNG